MIKWIIVGVLTALTITFAFLKSVWTGFIYLGISFLSLLAIYVLYIRIRKYITDYYTNFEKAFVRYRADYINSHNITSQEFEQNIEEHQKTFKDLFRKEKAVDMFIMLFILTILIVSIISIIKL